MVKRKRVKRDSENLLEMIFRVSKLTQCLENEYFSVKRALYEISDIYLLR